MNILFATRKMQKTMNDSKARRQEYGDLAKPLGRRLDDLRGIATLDEAFLLPGRLEPLSGDRLGQFSMRLTGNWRLIFEPANESLPKSLDGATDLARITEIRILDVEDYH